MLKYLNFEIVLHFLKNLHPYGGFLGVSYKNTIVVINWQALFTLLLGVIRQPTNFDFHFELFGVSLA